MKRIELPVGELQQSVGDLVKRSQRSTFDSEARKALYVMLSRLSGGASRPACRRKALCNGRRGRARRGRRGRLWRRRRRLHWWWRRLCGGRRRRRWRRRRQLMDDSYTRPYSEDLRRSTFHDPRENLVKGATARRPSTSPPTFTYCARTSCALCARRSRASTRATSCRVSSACGNTRRWQGRRSASRAGSSSVAAGLVRG